MYSGVRGRGAADAWYRTAADLECNTLHGRHTSITTVDVFKCFDQLDRELIYALMSIAGWPPMTTRAYAAMMEGVRIHG
eukprot:968879-Alexandrium_andersonii.AAC.1